MIIFNEGSEAMFGKILLAIDGSEHSMKAADSALELAKINGAQVEILYVCHTLDHYMRDSAELIESLEKKLEEEAEAIIAKAEEKFKGTGIQYTTKILQGDAAEVICDEAQENGIGVIIMGSRGLSGISRFVLGSVSSKVLGHACCSVLIVR
ncbi:MAG: universal stress protein [Dehalobacterium sp.]